MNATERARRSDSLYYDTQVTNRRALCDMIAHLESDLAESKAENAKLRELAVLNWEWAHSCCGNNCKMWTDGCGYQIDRECNYEREIYDRMHELGIELNDCE